MEIEELKPCPFCGAPSEEISIKVKRYHGSVIGILGQKFWYVECLPCDARTGYCFDGDAEYHGFPNGKEFATHLWNKRPT